jgi:predicted secreted protein
VEYVIVARLYAVIVYAVIGLRTKQHQEACSIGWVIGLVATSKIAGLVTTSLTTIYIFARLYSVTVILGYIYGYYIYG